MNEMAVRIAFCGALCAYLSTTQTSYETRLDQIKLASEERWDNMRPEARDILPRGTRYDDMWAAIQTLFNSSNVREGFSAKFSVTQIESWAWTVLARVKPDELAPLYNPFSTLPT